MAATMTIVDTEQWRIAADTWVGRVAWGPSPVAHSHNR